jgi:diketogulonate reductase-like aldo/keto reductase
MAVKLKPLGNTGEMIPELGIGTWKMGGTPQNEIDAIKKSISLKMGFVDTAEMYGNERMVGEAIKGEKGVFLATKVSPHHFKHDDVIKACKTSISKLGVKTIDLYQLHWPSASVPIKETMSAMEELVDMGLIRHIGISNYSVEETKAAQEAMKKYEIVSNQVEYSLLVRDIEQGLLDYCKKSKITIISYSPLAQGAITKGSQPLLSESLQAIGTKYNKTPAQVALNWVISHDNVVTIPKTSSPARVEENAGASGWKMEAEETKMLEDAAIGKRSMTSGLKSLGPGVGLLFGTYQGFQNFKNRNSHKSSSTTKSSKK